MPTITILQDDLRVEVSTTQISQTIVIIRARIVVTHHGLEVVLRDQAVVHHVVPGIATLIGPEN